MSINPTSEWQDIVPWADGEWMTEQKLDTQQGNADYLRDLVIAQVIACAPGECWGWSTVNYPGLPGGVGSGSQGRFRFETDSGSETGLVTTAGPPGHISFTDPISAIYTRFAAVNELWTPAPSTANQVLRCTPEITNDGGSNWYAASSPLVEWQITRTVDGESVYFNAWLDAHWALYGSRIITKGIVVIATRVDPGFAENA